MHAEPHGYRDDEKETMTIGRNNDRSAKAHLDVVTANVRFSRGHQVSQLHKVAATIYRYYSLLVEVQTQTHNNEPHKDRQEKSLAPAAHYTEDRWHGLHLPHFFSRRTLHTSIHKRTATWSKIDAYDAPERMHTYANVNRVVVRRVPYD